MAQKVNHTEHLQLRKSELIALHYLYLTGLPNLNQNFLLFPSSTFNPTPPPPQKKNQIMFLKLMGDSWYCPCCKLSGQIYALFLSISLSLFMEGQISYSNSNYLLPILNRTMSFLSNFDHRLI